MRRRGWTLPLFGRIQESEQLGSGNFCVTYKCRNRLDGKSYAIKRARKRMHGDADKRRMLREVFALSALVDVPNIVQYHTAWIEDDRLYIQLGYCNGGTIQDIMRSGLSKSKTNTSALPLKAGVEAEKVLEEPVALNGRLTPTVPWSWWFRSETAWRKCMGEAWCIWTLSLTIYWFQINPKWHFV